jgi:hypothetical protein
VTELPSMKSLLVALLALSFTTAFCADNIQVYFSLDGRCTAAVAGQLTKARSLALVQAYLFTSSPFAKALVKAKSQGQFQESTTAGMWEVESLGRVLGGTTIIQPMDDSYNLTLQRLQIIEGGHRR